MALERMLAGLSTRRYPAGLEPVGARTEKAATATSRRRCRGGSSPRPRPRWPSCSPRTCPALDLVALMVDGVHFGEHTCVVALGIGIDGTKHPLSLVEGSTENATLVTELIVGLRERGLDVTRPILVVLDGSKALRRAVLDVFDRPVLGRCQLHKIRNVADHLPEKLRSVVTSRMRRAYHADSAWPPRPNWPRWPPSWTAPTPARRRACARAWQPRYLAASSTRSSSSSTPPAAYIMAAARGSLRGSLRAVFGDKARPAPPGCWRVRASGADKPAPDR